MLYRAAWLRFSAMKHEYPGQPCSNRFFFAKNTFFLAADATPIDAMRNI
jgi:hypothetical protein